MALLTNIYITGLVAKQQYGSEVILMSKQSIQSIEKVSLEFGKKTLINLKSDQIGLDFSAIKSLCKLLNI